MALVGLARISSGPGQAPCQIRVGNEIAGFGTEFLRDGPFPTLTWGYAGLQPPVLGLRFQHLGERVRGMVHLADRKPSNDGYRLLRVVPRGQGPGR